MRWEGIAERIDISRKCEQFFFFFFGKSEGKRPFEDLCLDGRITLD
jgi:hypothetical protein